MTFNEVLQRKLTKVTPNPNDPKSFLEISYEPKVTVSFPWYIDKALRTPDQDEMVLIPVSLAEACRYLDFSEDRWFEYIEDSPV